MLCLSFGMSLIFLSGASFERKDYLKSTFQCCAAMYFIIAGIGNIGQSNRYHMMTQEQENEYKEVYELTIKLARRCVYDLRHCVELLPTNYKDIYRPRMENYENIFEAATGSKDYRHRLHRTICEQQTEIKTLKSLLEQHGVDLPQTLPL